MRKFLNRFLYSNTKLAPWLYGLVAAVISIPTIALSNTVAAEYSPIPNSLWVSSDGRYFVTGNYQHTPWSIFDRQTQTSIAIPQVPPIGSASIESMSDDLRYAIVLTNQPLVSQDTNNAVDIYIFDRQNESFELVSQSTEGSVGNGGSSLAGGKRIISSDGRYIVFRSQATNLDQGTDNNNSSDIFIRDRTLGTTTRITNDSSGNAGNAESQLGTISADGNIITVITSASNVSGAPGNNLQQVVNIDRRTGNKQRVSIPQGIPDANGYCTDASISSDGHYTAFICSNQLLINNYYSDGSVTPGPNSGQHVYRYDRDTNNLRIVDFPDNGNLANYSMNDVHISADGQRVTFLYRYAGYYWDSSRGTAIEYTDAGVQSLLQSEDGLTGAAQILSGPEGIWNLPTYSIMTTQDNTIPVIQPTISGGSLSWSISDPESAVAATHGCEPVSLNTLTQITTITCIAASAGGVAVKSVTVGDSTPPTIQQVSSPLPNTNGWNSGPVSLSWSISDPESPITDRIGCNTATITSSGTYTCTAISSGGTSSKSVTIKIDSSAPVISASRSPAPNASGWNNSSVTITYACNDTESGIASCSNPITLDTEGTNQSVTGTGIDNAGNSSSTTVSGINIDKTAPTATGGTINGWLVIHWANPTITANASDSLSGVVGGEYYIDSDPGQGNGKPMTYDASTGKIKASPVISSGSNGYHTIYMRSKDAAGNWSATTSVQYFYVF